MRYGRERLNDWMLTSDCVYLNHGTVGATPRRVIAEYRRIQDEIESQPAQFLLRELADVDGQGDPAEPHMRVAARRIASHLRCSANQLGFVDNATTGVNAVVRSFTFRPGDEVVVTSLGYGAVNYAAKYAVERAGGTVREIQMPDPGSAPEDFTRALISGVGDSTVMAIIDHITSGSALVLPIAEMCRELRRAGVASLVDGAHAPGAIPLNVEEIGADWYTANLHKWAWAPRSCGVLWARHERLSDIHPVTISWGSGNGFEAEFDLLGTRDPAPYLTAPFAMDLWNEWGGQAIIEHNHSLAWEGAHYIADAIGSAVYAPRDMVGPMVAVPLPLRAGTTKAAGVALQRALLLEDHIECAVNLVHGQLYVRVSAQIYNDSSDFDKLADALKRRLA